LYNLIAFNLISSTFSLGGCDADKASVGMASGDVDVDVGVEVDAYRTGTTARAVPGLARVRIPWIVVKDERIIPGSLAVYLYRWR
jgi:hypothetical protein